MPYVNGVYTPPAGAESAAPGQVIRSAVWNTIHVDIANAFSDLGTPSIEYVLGQVGVGLAPGNYGFLEIPFPCTITGWKILGSAPGTCQLDVWKVPFGSFPPSVANSIVGSAPPNLAAQQSNSSTTLTGWTTTINAGDILAFVVTSGVSPQQVTLSLNVGRN